MPENIAVSEFATIAAHVMNPLYEGVVLGRASALIEHKRAKRFIMDSATGLMLPDLDTLELVSDPELVWNVITTAGRDYLHSQGYNTSGGAANGFCFVALSNDTLTETSASTVLSNEIAANGLTRAVGVYAHTNGTNTTTITKTFTASGTQSAQKAALFTASSAGTMNHALAFTQRNLVTSDTLAVTFTITLG